MQQRCKRPRVANCYPRLGYVSGPVNGDADTRKVSVPKRGGSVRGIGETTRTTVKIRRDELMFIASAKILGRLGRFSQ